MPKILDYNTLTTTAGCNVLFIGDKNSSITNPEIKNITVDNLFKRETFCALNANGIRFYDDGGIVSLFIKDGGNVGIGGTTANYSLQVNGGFYVTGGIYDCNGSCGSGDQYLKSVGSANYVWADISALGGGTVSGGGSANYIPKWSSSSALTDSIIYEASSKIGIGETDPNATLHIEGSASGSDAIVQNINGAVIELRRDCGTTVTNSLYLSNTGSGFSLGSSNSFANSNININSTGSLGVRTTTLSAALNVSTNQLLVGDFYSSDSSGSVIYFKNTSSCSSAYSNVVSYSSNDGSQKVNWITGTFQDGSFNKHFGISYKNANLSQSDAKFDSSTICNNLFYINTGGSASLAHNIHTHNKTNTGHNTGRFVCVYSVPFDLNVNFDGTADAEGDFVYFPAFQRSGLCVGNFNSSAVSSICGYFSNISWTCVSSGATSFNKEGLEAFGRNQYAAKLIKITSYINSQVVVNGSGSHQFELRFYCAPADAGDFTWAASNHEASLTVDKANYNMANANCAVRSTVHSNNVSVDIPINSYLAAGMVGSSGPVYGAVDFTYELKIT